MPTNDQFQFDETGVSNYIRDKRVLNWFREKVQRYKVPLDKQAPLAAVFLNEAVEHNKGWLTLPFLKNHNYEDYIPSFIEHGASVEVTPEIGEQIKLEAVQHQLQRELKDFTKGLATMFRSGRVIDGLLKQYPQAHFHIDNDSRRLIQMAQKVVDDLAEKLKPTSRWGKS